jgi:UDP-N-acetyl-D-galactosamine dehydrogenase
MGLYVTDTVVKLMTRKSVHVVDSDVLIMGLSFKENCPDIRNTRVIDIIRELQNYNANVDIYDPWVDPVEAGHEYGVTTLQDVPSKKYDAVIVAVAHQQFVDMGPEGIKTLLKPRSVLFDIKNVLPRGTADARL